MSSAIDSEASKDHKIAFMKKWLAKFYQENVKKGILKPGNLANNQSKSRGLSGSFNT